jgi:hypothetical protein
MKLNNSQKGIIMLNAEQATAEIQAIPYPSAQQFNNREERTTALMEYRAAQDAVIAEFRAYLEDTYAWAHTPEARQTIWAAAWGNGHASGYANVEAHYMDYAELSDEKLEELDY